MRGEKRKDVGRKSDLRDVAGDRCHCKFARFLAIVNQLSKVSGTDGGAKCCRTCRNWDETFFTHLTVIHVSL